MSLAIASDRPGRGVFIVHARQTGALPVAQFDEPAIGWEATVLAGEADPGPVDVRDAETVLHGRGLTSDDQITAGRQNRLGWEDISDDAGDAEAANGFAPWLRVVDLDEIQALV